MNIGSRIKNASPWNFLWISVAFSELLTLILSTIASLAIWGRVDKELLLVGAIDACLVPLVVAPFIIYYCTRQTYRLRESNVLLQKEITERKRVEENFRTLSLTDTLTSLPNRTLFTERLRFVVSSALRHKRTAVVMFIDLDNFKHVNDSLGHRYGDLLLQGVAEKLRNLLRATDTVARPSHEESPDLVSRLGGDEFTVILSEIKNINDAALVARRILDALSQPFLLAEREVYVTPSIGISLCPLDSSDPEELVKFADIAMYRAKASGKNNYKFFEHSMNVAIMKKHTLESHLHRALEHNEFVLHYQPQMDLLSGEIVGMEALIRWNSPDLGMVSPLDFIPLAEDTGLIFPIGEWVIHTACRQIREWQGAGFSPKSVSVNLSGLQFQRHDFITNLMQIVAKNSLDPRLLILEITESIMMENKGMAVETLRALNEAGFRFSIDDFGTGYSSLSYLKSFPLYSIKIDRSFLVGLTSNADDMAIVKSIIDMIHSLKMRVVAEGVETEGQVVFLCENNCDEIQGYVVSRPLPPEDATELLIREHEMDSSLQERCAARLLERVKKMNFGRTGCLGFLSGRHCS